MITFKKWQQLHESLGLRTLGVSTPASVGIISSRPLEGQETLEEARKKMKKKMLAGGYKDPEEDDDDETNDIDKKKVADTDDEGDDDDDGAGQNAGHEDDEKESGDGDAAAGEDDGDTEDADSDPRVKKQPKKVNVDMMKKKMKKESTVAEGKMPPWLNKGKGGDKDDDGDDDKGDDKKKGGKSMPPWMGKKKSDSDDDCKSKKSKDASKRFDKIKDKVKDEAAEAFDDMFFSSLTDNIGSPNTKNKDGWTEYQVDEEALLPPEDPNAEVSQEPGPGEVGYAPTGRYGQPLGPQVAESRGKAKKKK